MSHLPGVFLTTQSVVSSAGETWQISADESDACAHLKALRLKNGDACLLLNGRGEITRVELIDSKTFAVKTLDHRQVAPAALPIDLYLSPPKGDDLDRSLQICVELGVRRLHLFQSEHSAHTTTLKLGRLRRIAQSSCEQSLNPWLPEIIDHGRVSLAELVATAHRHAKEVLSFDESLAETKSFFKVKSPAASYACFVGPEGGWSAAERELFASLKVSRASLGPIVLKVPTAICAALSVLRSST
ncbi:MAG TPA: RsmE family RNA methyltransferase [Bdellovibrionota bacterium]|jgi:16S rRNA (uracil1498-N3)-methyltransferase|nr:RsmE family RNA methyltransferase [Bdellovibrionota bacterium]